MSASRHTASAVPGSSMPPRSSMDASPSVNACTAWAASRARRSPPRSTRATSASSRANAADADLDVARAARAPGRARSAGTRGCRATGARARSGGTPGCETSTTSAAGIVGRGHGVDRLAQHLEQAAGERLEQALLGAEDAVHGAGGRADGVGHRPDRCRVGALLVDQPLGRVEQRLPGRVAVLPGSSHGLTRVSQLRYVTK